MGNTFCLKEFDLQKTFKILWNWSSIKDPIQVTPMFLL